jgi:urea transport system permease protein
VRSLIRLFITFFTISFACGAGFSAQAPRDTLVAAMLAEDAARKTELILSLAGVADESIKPVLDAWKEDALFIHQPAEGAAVVVQLTGEKDDDDAQTAVRVDTGAPLLDASGKPLRLVAGDLTGVEHDASLRRAMKSVLDLIAVASPDVKKRIQAIQAIGFSQDIEKLPALRKRLEVETDSLATKTLREAVAVTQLKAPDEADKLTALVELKQLH